MGFFEIDNDYLELCNKKNHLKLSFIIDLFQVVNYSRPHHFLISAKHDVYTKSNLPINTKNELVNVKKGIFTNWKKALSFLVCKTKWNCYLNLGYYLKTVIWNKLTATNIYTSIRTKVLELSKIVGDLPMNYFSNRTVIECVK